ncbi:MAG: protein-L-isoaspartate O-methyltransferase [Steroidobacteraceae bacterium]
MHATIEATRRQMVSQQVRTWDVLDPRTLEAMAAVPRERFVPEQFRDAAYADAPIPLGHGQHMLPPKTDGRILQALAINAGDTILDVGTGSGYLAACLAHRGGRVRSLEIFPDLAASAMRNLAASGFPQVAVEVADASRFSEVDRYDVIAVSAALPAYDRRFERALRVGGRLFLVVGRPPVMFAKLVVRTGADEWVAENLFETEIDPMVNATAPSGFRF